MWYKVTFFLADKDEVPVKTIRRAMSVAYWAAFDGFRATIWEMVGTETTNSGTNIAMFKREDGRVQVVWKKAGAR